MALFPFPKLIFSAHLSRLKVNILQVYYLTVYLNSEVCDLMHAVYPSCNIHLILKFYVGLNYIRAVSLAVLQKNGSMGVKFENLRIQMGWSSVCGGGLETSLSWGLILRGLVIRGADTPLHSMENLHGLKEWVLNPGFFYLPTYRNWLIKSLSNYDALVVFFACSRFIKKSKGSKYSQLKISRSHYSAIFSNSWLAWNQFLAF